MKNYLRLTFSLLITCCLHAAAGTSGFLTYEVVGGTTISITDCQTSASGTVTIPATLEGKPVTSIAGAAFWDCSSMTGIVIPENVTSIGNNQFYGCAQLVRAIFKGDAPSAFSGLFDDAAGGFKIYYGDEATGFAVSPWSSYITESYDSRFSFEIVSGSSDTITITDYPLSLGSTEIDVPATLVGLPVICIGAGSFSGQMLAIRITLPDSITRIENDAFYECSGLTTFTISAAVTFIGAYAFEDAYNLDSLFFEGNAPQRGEDIFGGRTPKIYYLDAHAQYFEDDDYPWANIEKYTDLYNFEVYKETIKITDYPDTETGGITIPETIVGKPVTRIVDFAFDNCDELTRISLPDSMEQIGMQAFELCSGLTTITIPTNVTSIGFGAYGGCTLESVFFDGDVPASLGASLFGGAAGFTVYYRDGSAGFSEPTWNGYTAEAYTGPLSFTVTEEEVYITDCLTSVSGAFVIPNQIVGKPVVALDQSSFYLCNNITSIFIPNTMTTIHQSAFGTAALTEYSVDVGNPAYSSEDGVIFNKTKSQLIHYPEAKAGDYIVPDTVISIIDQAFYSCDYLFSVIIPESVITNSWLAFGDCSRLQQAVFLGNAPTSFSSLAFDNTAATFKIYYPEGKTGFTPDLKGYPTESFDGKFSLKIHSVYQQAWPMVPETLTQSIEITDYPETETGELIIPETLIDLPVTTIGTSAFESCTNLTTITVPEGVTTIDGAAFYGCENLKTAIFSGDAPDLGYSWSSGFPPSPIMTVFDETDPDFMIYYFSDHTGFSSPTWEGYPATEINLDTRPLALWLIEHGIVPDADIGADLNGDGVDLLMEYALNLNPLENNAGNTPYLDFDNPQMGVISIWYYASQSDVTYTVDTSSDLKTWTTQGVVYTPFNGNYRAAWVPQNGTKQFLRLRVEVDTP